jgi:hypothetical protein
MMNSIGIGTFFLIEREGYEDSERYYYLFKRLGDKYVAKRKKEFRRAIDVMEQSIEKLLWSLESTIETRLKLYDWAASLRP